LQLLATQTEHELKVRTLQEEVDQQHAEVDSLQQRFSKGDPAAIVSYFTQVLEASDYPLDFPHHTRMAFVPESKQLVVELELPGIEVVPKARAYKYVKTRNEITETARPQRDIKSLYASVISPMSLRTLHEIFEADREGQIDTVAFNGFVKKTDSRTGKAISPYLITVRTTRDAFEELDLQHVDPLQCLKGLQASVSRSPSELAPVRPVVDFNMFDDRFIEESDVLSTLDQRPNLMELTPGEFDSLITNLFESMGLETRMTHASRDGGVDCVAWDQRPILGGNVVIQAKRYKNTVGVSAVGDLFGTVQNEGASKGILVTTSGYGKASFDFASGKPLELLDGGNLLYLLEEHAGIDARIEVPEDWVDPLPDTG
jgi:restriction system protein